MKKFFRALWKRMNRSGRICEAFNEVSRRIIASDRVYERDKNLDALTRRHESHARRLALVKRTARRWGF